MDAAPEDPAAAAEGAVDAEPEGGPETAPETAPEGGILRGADELWRIGGSLAAVRSEVHHLKTLDDRSLRQRITALEQGWLVELEGILPESLSVELRALLGWSSSGQPSGSELRIALAQLEGWLDGVIAGLGVVVKEPTDR